MPDAPPPLPQMIELAPLPRQQAGPFLTLGVDKESELDEIEKAWAQRLIWARKNQISIPLEEINWARDSLKDTGKRISADSGTLNVDSADGLLKQLKQRFQGKDADSGSCRPIDVEKSLAHYLPPTPLPDIDELRNNLPMPHIPREFPVMQAILNQFLAQPLDPWEVV